MNIDFVEAKKELENIFKHTETHRKNCFFGMMKVKIF